MNSTTAPNISISGLLRSTKTKGFTTHGALKEITDNSFDALATKIAIRVNTTTRELIVSDNGAGMNNAVADKAYCLHNDKTASSKNGLYGIGKSAAEGMLSNLESATMTVTKAAGGRMYEITAEWPSAIATNTWNPRASGASSDIGAPLWDREALDPDHGTVVSIPMTQMMCNEIVSEMPDIIRGICFAYQDHRDVVISVSIDGVDQPMDHSDTLGWNDVDADQRGSTSLEIWCKSDAPNYVYHSEGGEMVRLNWDAVTKDGVHKDALQSARIHDYASMLDAGYSLHGKFDLRTVYNPRWNPDPVDDDDNVQRPEFKRGHLSFRRNMRYLARFDAVIPASGDYERRRTLGSVRSSLDFTHICDKFIKTEGNKSNVTKDNVDKLLLRTAMALIRKWSIAYYVRYIAPAHVEHVVGNANIVPRDAMALFKLNYSNPAWRTAYIEFIAAHPIA